MDIVSFADDFEVDDFFSEVLGQFIRFFKVEVRLYPRVGDLVFLPFEPGEHR